MCGGDSFCKEETYSFVTLLLVDLFAKKGKQDAFCIELIFYTCFFDSESSRLNQILAVKVTEF